MKKFIIILIIIGIVLSGCRPVKDTHKIISGTGQEFTNDFKTVSQYPISKDMAALLFLSSLSEEEVIATISPTPVSEINMENAMETAMGLLGVKTDWPKDYLSPDMPPYTKGKINGWNSAGGGKFDVFILVKDTRRQDLEEYIRALINNGFYENNGSYTKDAFTVKFQFNNDTVLQISSYKVEPIEWPELLNFIPPLTKGYLTFVNTPTENELYGDLNFKGLSKADIREWEEKLPAAGFTIDSGEYRKENVRFKGKAYTFSAFFDNNGTNEWNLYFMFE